MRFSRVLSRLVLYGLAAALPPLGVGLAVAMSSVSGVMIHNPPQALPSGAQAKPIAPSRRRARAVPKKTAYILLSDSGQEVTEVLGAYEMLGESGAFDVKTAAAHRDLVKTASDLAIEPDLALADVHGGDLLVLPTPVNPEDAELISFLGAHSGEFKLILICGEAARLAVHTPLLAGRKATTHFVAAGDLASNDASGDPPVQWIPGPRYVEDVNKDGNVITTAGIGATLDGVLQAISVLAGAEVARRTAEDLHWDWSRETTESMVQDSGWEKLRTRDLLWWFYNAGYEWNHKSVGVLVYPGISELGMAAALDTFPRSYTMSVSTVAAERGLIRTRHGMLVAPALDVGHAPPMDLLLVPSRSQTDRALTENDPLENPAVHRWVVETGVSVKSLIYDAPGVSFKRCLDLLDQIRGPWITERVAQLLRVPYVTSRPNVVPTQLWLRPLLLAFLGLFLAWRIDARLSQQPKPR